MTVPWSLPNVRAYPNAIHSTLMSAMATNDCTIVAMTFLAPTRPP
jgi:hypothetical protein